MKFSRVILERDTFVPGKPSKETSWRSNDFSAAQGFMLAKIGDDLWIGRGDETNVVAWSQVVGAMLILPEPEKAPPEDDRQLRVPGSERPKPLHAVKRK